MITRVLLRLQLQFLFRQNDKATVNNDYLNNYTRQVLLFNFYNGFI